MGLDIFETVKTSSVISYLDPSFGTIIHIIFTTHLKICYISSTLVFNVKSFYLVISDYIINNLCVDF